MSEQAADVLIVGGGLMGAATAFFLRRRGRSVTLLERDLIGQQASGTNFGNVRRQGRFLPQLPLATRSRAIWGRLPELLGEDAEFLPTGHVRVCFRAEEIGQLETYARDARDYGLELELLGRNALRERFPFLSPDAVAGSYSPQDGHANPRLAAPAFARAARRAGAISAGAWSDVLSARFGEAVPLVVRGPQMAVTEPAPYAIEPVVGVYSGVAEEGVYLRQVRRGNVVFGGGLRGPAFADISRAYADPAAILHQLPHLRRIVPALGALRVIRSWSGIEGYMDDDIPVMGPSAKMPGLFYAFGFCGHGFQLGPGVGEVMAELIDTGRSETPIAPFHIARFARGGVTVATRDDAPASGVGH